MTDKRERTDFVELSLAREANSSLSNLEIPLILWNPKVVYRVHSSPPLLPILSQINSQTDRNKSEWQ